MSEAHIEPTDELAQFLSDLEASEINGEITLSWMYRPPMDGQDRRAGRLTMPKAISNRLAKR